MALTVTHDNEHNPLWGDERLLSVVGSRSFTEMLFQLLSGQIPTTKELELFELLLKLSIDHGPDTPSAKMTIASAKKGAPMGRAVGNGVVAINETHGGATEPAMRLYYEIADGKKSVESVVEKILGEKKRLPGFGHRLYNKDPRAECILEAILRLGSSKKYLTVIHKLEAALAKRLPGKRLPLNVDGAIAVALCTLGWKPEESTALFISARSAGLSAHYLNTVRESAG